MSVVDGFRIVFTNRVAFFYGLAGMFLFGALFGFITSSQQIYVDIYGLGVYFPVAFAAMAGLMALLSYPAPVRTIASERRWTPEEIATIFPHTLGLDLVNPAPPESA